MTKLEQIMEPYNEDMEMYKERIENFKPTNEEKEDKLKKFSIQELLDKHEAFKLKWLQLSDDDLFNWIWLQDTMISEVSKMKSEWLENKLQIEKDKSLRTIEMKSDLDEKWKAPTDKWIEAVLKQEFFEKDLAQNVLKTSYELLAQKLQTITEFVNIVKMNKKWAFSI